MDLLIRAGTVIEGAEDAPLRSEQGIAIENGRIAGVDAWGQFDGSTARTVIDARGYTVMPGLIDAHTHVVHTGDGSEDWRLIPLTELTATTALKAAANAKRHLEMGVTTIRDLGAWDWVDIALRDAIRAGWQVGPRIVACGHGITSTGGHMDARRYARPGIPAEALASLGVVADSADQARTAAWEQLMRGADVLKLNATLSEYVRALGGQCSPEMTYEAMAAVCEVAHNAGRKVAAHCHGGPGVQAAIDAGVDTFEHGRFISEELYTQMAEKGRFVVPTLSPEARRIERNDPPGDPATARWYAMATDAMYASVARAHACGVPVVAGSDAGMPYVVHGGIGFEMVHLAQADLSNRTVVAAATSVAAQALGLEDEIGQVKKGLVADLIVVDGNPLEDIGVLQRPESIVMVIQAGKVVVDRRQQ